MMTARKNKLWSRHTMKTKKIKKEILKFNAVFLEEEDSGYSVSVPSLPGCFSQGDTFEDAAANIKEAMELYLEGEQGEDHGWLAYRGKHEFMAPVEVHG
jgi:predicted RNase H-like HicB family nuclease